MAFVKKFHIQLGVKVFTCKSGGFLAALDGTDISAWAETADKAVERLFSQINYNPAPEYQEVPDVM